MESRNRKPQHERRIIDWLIAFFCIALAILLFFFLQQYKTLRRESIINAHASWIVSALKDHPHPTASDTDIIRTWMTFDYVNKLFGLPPGYLKDQLSISDTAYPRLTIGKFAKENSMSPSSTLMNVQEAVSQYLSAPTGTPLGGASST